MPGRHTFYVTCGNGFSNTSVFQAVRVLTHSRTCNTHTQEMGMTDEKLSGLFSLMKEVHLRSTGECMALELSFIMFKV